MPVTVEVEPRSNVLTDTKIYFSTRKSTTAL